MKPSEPRQLPRDEIPVIDLGGGPERVARVARAIGSACEREGFFYIDHHGVPSELVEEVFAQSRRFHGQPIEAKRALAINSHHRGYIGLSSYRLNETLAPNLSESLVLMHEVSREDPIFGQPLQGPNQWPELDGFRDVMLRYVEALSGLGRRILNAFALALALPDDSFEPMFRTPTTFLRLLHYPPQPEGGEENQFGSAPHTDYGAITILAQDASGGLHLRHRSGDWMTAPPIPGTFVVNIGDVMARWTNDRFVSTPHRVVNASGGDRYSVPFFFDPDMGSEIVCLETCRGEEGSPRYQPIRYGDYLLGRLDEHYAYRTKPVD